MAVFLTSCGDAHLRPVRWLLGKEQLERRAAVIGCSCGCVDITSCTSYLYTLYKCIYLLLFQHFNFTFAFIFLIITYSSIIFVTEISTFFIKTLSTLRDLLVLFKAKSSSLLHNYISEILKNVGKIEMNTTFENLFVSCLTGDLVSKHFFSIS